MEAHLQFDAGSGCPLYGSASHGLPNEQLGHQWRFAMVLAWGVPRTQRQWNLLHLGLGEKQRAQGWVSQAPVGAAPKPGFMGLVAAPSPGSADRALGSLGCQPVRQDVLWLKGLEAWGTLSLPCGDSCFVALPWPCGWEGGRCCFEIRIGGRAGPRTASQCRPF